jgi:hypothetical protein
MTRDATGPILVVGRVNFPTANVRTKKETATAVSLSTFNDVGELEPRFIGECVALATKTHSGVSRNKTLRGVECR